MKIIVEIGSTPEGSAMVERYVEGEPANNAELVVFGVVIESIMAAQKMLAKGAQTFTDITVPHGGMTEAFRNSVIEAHKRKA